MQLQGCCLAPPPVTPLLVHHHFPHHLLCLDLCLRAPPLLLQKRHSLLLLLQFLLSHEQPSTSAPGPCSQPDLLTQPCPGRSHRCPSCCRCHSCQHLHFPGHSHQHQCSHALAQALRRSPRPTAGAARAAAAVQWASWLPAETAAALQGLPPGGSGRSWGEAPAPPWPLAEP